MIRWQPRPVPLSPDSDYDRRLQQHLTDTYRDLMQAFARGFSVDGGTIDGQVVVNGPVGVVSDFPQLALRRLSDTNGLTGIVLQDASGSERMRFLNAGTSPDSGIAAQNSGVNTINGFTISVNGTRQVLSVGGQTAVTDTLIVNNPLSSVGAIIMRTGGLSASGYAEFMSPSGIRQGYVGFSDTADPADTGRVYYKAGRHSFLGSVVVDGFSPAYAAANRGTLDVNGATAAGGALYGFQINNAGVGYMAHISNNMDVVNQVTSGAIRFSANSNVLQLRPNGALALPVLSADPASPNDGDIWYVTGVGFRKRHAGTSSGF
jgi:hypothetical protein